MDGTDHSPTREAHAEPAPGPASETLQAYREAHARFKADPGLESERDLLLCAVPILRGILQRTRREWPAGERREECGALDMVAAALEDRLSGWGWPSLTRPSPTQGFNHIQRVAMAFGFAYVEAARAGRIVDPDPIGTVCLVYARRKGKPLAPRSLERWKSKYPPLEIDFSWVFKGNPAVATHYAREALRRYSRYIRRKPSDTFL